MQIARRIGFLSLSRNQPYQQNTILWLQIQTSANQRQLLLRVAAAGRALLMVGCISLLYNPYPVSVLFPSFAAAWSNFFLHLKYYFPSAYLLAGVTFGIMVQLSGHLF